MEDYAAGIFATPLKNVKKHDKNHWNKCCITLSRSAWFCKQQFYLEIRKG